MTAQKESSLNRVFDSRRAKEQSMGIWLSEPVVLHPEKLEAAVRDLAERGFGIVRLMLRNTSFTHRSPQVVSAVGQMVKVAHELNVKVVLDCEPHATPVGHDMACEFPDALGYRLVRASAKVVDGHYRVHVPSPGTMGERADFLGVEAAFFQVGKEMRRLSDLDYNLRQVAEPYEDGYTTIEHNYTEGRPGNPTRRVTHLSGRLEPGTSGELVIYLRFFDSRRTDVWSDGFRKYFESLIECYREIPLDGIGWDEPAIGGAWNNYISGDAFTQAFKERCGYELQDRLYLLDEPGTRPESLQVRLDYYETLNEGLVAAQKHLFEKTAEVFGDDYIGGTHHTWQGEGNIPDCRAGAVDYFRLNDNMDAGYTDCWWWDAKSVCYAYTLGSSLGRLTPTGEAEINTWDAKPTNSKTEYHVRLMSLMNVLWFNIWYGEASDTCLYPADYTWETAVREMQRHRKAQQLLAGAKPVVKVAMLHGWETVCGINRPDIAGAHKAFTLNQSTLWMNRSEAFDWIDTRLLAGAQVEGTSLLTDLGTYEILVLPFASILPRQAWEMCLEFAKAGGKIVFTGTPPAWDTEGGDLSIAFAELMEMPHLSLERYLSGVDAVCKLPAGRPQNLDIAYPLSGDPERLLTSIENEVHGIRNPNGNVIYLTDLEPGARLLEHLEPWLPREVVCYSETIMWRLYRDGGRDCLALIARQDRKLSGIVKWGEITLELTSGLVAMVELCHGELKVHGEDVTWQLK
jgi:hypothetical protein